MATRTEKNKNIRKKINNEERLKRKKRRNKVIKKIFCILLIILIIGLFYARFIEPNMLFIHEEKLSSTTIGNNFDGLKAVHFSDLHYGSTVKEKQLKKIINEINELKPDIVIFTGDLIEQDYTLTEDDKKILPNSLKEIESTYGNYAIIGNHDYYNDDFMNVIYDSNFIYLNNSYDVIYSYDNESIGIYGVDDVIYGEPNLDKYNENEFTNTTYKILLVHEPDYVDEIINNYKFDLILSGHSHNQQVRIPFFKGFWLPIGSKTYYEPYYNINGTHLYISNGLGTSLIELRFLSPPSINFFRITKK